MQVFVACCVNGVMVEGFCEIEEYEIDREIKKGSFSRNGKLPPKICSRLLLSDSIFKLKYGEEYQFKIINEPFVRYMPVTDVLNISSSDVMCKMMPAQLIWVIELR